MTNEKVNLAFDLRNNPGHRSGCFDRSLHRQVDTQSTAVEVRCRNLSEAHDYRDGGYRSRYPLSFRYHIREWPYCSRRIHS